jgi:aryl-alcohol dehydrogenase-like predicted oxidoreductase
MMKYTNLGQSGLRVSRICVGCMSFGDRRGRYKWCTEEADALPILEAAYNAGINFFDTANGYVRIIRERKFPIPDSFLSKYAYSRDIEVPR